MQQLTSDNCPKVLQHFFFNIDVGWKDCSPTKLSAQKVRAIGIRV